MRKQSSMFGGFFGGGDNSRKKNDGPVDRNGSSSTNGRSSQKKRRPANQDSGVEFQQIDHSYSSADESSRMESARVAVVQNTDNDPHRKIKFKRAKKLTKKASVAYLKTAGVNRDHRFHGWSKAELAQVMIANGIELRNEPAIDIRSLRDLCEALYFERDLPEKPILPNFFDIVVMHVRARRIQNTWINYCIRRREYEQGAETAAYIARMQRLAGNHDPDEEEAIGAAELLYMENPHQHIVGDADMDDEADLPQIDALEEGNAADGTDGEGKDEAGDPADAATTAVATADGSAPRRRRHKRKGTNVLDIPWVPPSIEKAEIYSNYVQPRRGGKGGSRFHFWHTTTGRHCCLGGLGEQFDLWEEGQISEFGIYGAGVTNYFKFIKWCFWVFVVMTVMSIPIIIMNTQGPNENNTGLQALATTTAGNLAVNQESQDFNIRIPACTSYGVYDVQCSLTRNQLSRFYAYLDVAIVLVAFFAFLWLRKFEKNEEATLEKNTVNASMFTVKVSNVPPDMTEDDLVEHFGKLCKDKKIAAISLAYDNVDEIEECMKRGKIIREKVREVHQHRQKCTLWKEKLSEEKANKRIDKERVGFFESMNTLTVKLKESEAKLEKLAEKSANVIYAFVTFDKVAGREAALERYHGHSLIYNWLYGQHLHLRNYPLKVMPASEPSTILWENLAFDKWMRFKRRALTTLLALLLVVVSLFVVFGAAAFEAANSGTVQGDDDSLLCPDNFDNLSDKEQRDVVDANPDIIYCYCDQFSTLEQARSSFCGDYFQERMESQILTYFASLIVLVVNIAMENTLKFFSDYELHHTEDGKNLGLFLRMFLLKYINTSCVFFVNNNDTILRNLFAVRTQRTAEFSADWFNTVGVTIILVQLGDVVTAHSDKLIKYLKFKWRLSRAKNPALTSALTQDDLNRAHVGPSFDFAFNYAQFLATIFVCWTFSAGIPLLYLLGAGNFIVSYFVEKYLFMNLYRIPPHFSNNVGKRATALIPYALVLHCAVAIWMFSNADLFDNNSQNTRTDDIGGDRISSSIRERLTGRTTLPLFIVCIFILVARILTQFFKGTLKTIRKVIETCLGRIACCVCCRSNAVGGNKKLASAQAVVTYTRAVQRNLIKGLANYNILQNPIYKEKFAITWKFAVQNKDVRSVRTLKAKAYTGDDETDGAKIAELQRNIPTADSLHKRRLNRNRSFASSFYSPPGASDKENNAENKSSRGSRNEAAATATAPIGQGNSGRFSSAPALSRSGSGGSTRKGRAITVDEDPRSRSSMDRSSADARPYAATGLSLNLAAVGAAASQPSPSANRSPHSGSLSSAARTPVNAAAAVSPTSAPAAVAPVPATATVAVVSTTSTTPRATAAPASPTTAARIVHATAQVVSPRSSNSAGYDSSDPYRPVPAVASLAAAPMPSPTSSRSSQQQQHQQAASGNNSSSREPKRTPRRIHVHRDGTVSTSDGTAPPRRFRHQSSGSNRERSSTGGNTGSGNAGVHNRDRGSAGGSHGYNAVPHSSRERPTSYDSRSSTGSGGAPAPAYNYARHDSNNFGRPLPPAPSPMYGAPSAGNSGGYAPLPPPGSNGYGNDPRMRSSNSSVGSDYSAQQQHQQHSPYTGPPPGYGGGPPGPYANNPPSYSPYDRNGYY